MSTKSPIKYNFPITALETDHFTMDMYIIIHQPALHPPTNPANISSQLGVEII